MVFVTPVVAPPAPPGVNIVLTWCIFHSSLYFLLCALNLGTILHPGPNRLI